MMQMFDLNEYAQLLPLLSNMGIVSSRDTKKKQEERNFRKENALPARNNNDSQDKIHAKSRRQFRKLNEDIEKVVEGRFNGEELRSECGSPASGFQNDLEADIQGAADTDANEEEERKTSFKNKTHDKDQISTHFNYRIPSMENPERSSTKITEEEGSSKRIRRIQVQSEQESFVAELLDRMDDLTKDVNKYKEQEKKKNSQYDYKCTEREEMVARIRHLEAQLEQVRDEKTQLLNRLSEISAMRLKDNNPNITDLSDVNRPLKLGEQFSSLYDDLWTDTFQILLERMKMNEKDIIHLLLKIVQLQRHSKRIFTRAKVFGQLIVIKITMYKDRSSKMVFETCKEEARSQNSHLQDAILKYIGLNKQNRDDIVAKEPVKMVQEYRQKNFTYSLKQIYKYVQSKLKEELPRKQIKQIKPYTKECTRICWLMNIRDPQMFLSFGKVYEIGKGGPSPFDNTCFVPYTCSGLYMEFVVWPALFLYEEGPLLKKGVAQGNNTPSVDTNSAIPLKTTKNGESNNDNEGPAILGRIKGMFTRKKQQRRHKEKEVSEMQNSEDFEDEIHNGEDNSGQNIEHMNLASDDPFGSNSFTHETNNIGLPTKTNIFQTKNYSSDITDVGS